MENKKSVENSNEDKSGIGSDNTFWIVVEALAAQGMPLPNEQIFEIKQTFFGQDLTIILKFRNNVTFVFSKQGQELSAIIKNESFRIENKEKESYQKKYYQYAISFLEEQKKILSEKSNLAKVKLERLGI